MSKKVISACIMLALCLATVAPAANIIWVSDNKNGTSVPADKGFVDLLKAQGYTVDYQGQGGTGTPGYQFWRTLDNAKIGTLNAADLIILSRDLNSGDYASNATEVTQWNGIKKPILMLIAHVARNDRWQWVETTGQNDAQPALQAVKTDHPVFNGVTLDANQRVNVFTGIGSISSATTAGNGTLIATRADNNQVWIAEWKTGQVFKSTTTQIAGGPRMLFAAGATGAGGPDGTLNLTPAGQKMFVNAVRYLLGDTAAPGSATAPRPADKAADVPRDVTLGWTAGKFAAAHDVYVGLSAADVNNAARANPSGVLASQGQNAASYAPTGLAFGQTYYWRVDEVNAPPSSIVIKGATWRFTVEPYAYSIKNVTATASSAQPGAGPEKTVDGSGLNSLDQHSTELSDMWLSAGLQPDWIQFAFDKAYKLSAMWVWNSNQMIESIVGFGVKSAKVEYSLDGSTWTELPGVPEFSQATGLPTYASNTTVNFGGVFAKYVKLTVNSHWGMAAPVGLSEVRFFTVPVQARAPEPATAATGVTVDAALNWRPGREAASHNVYFGTDQQAVIDGTVAAQTATDHSFSPSSLQLGTTYYWRVDEVNEAAATKSWAGDVWSFTTEEYRAVDDFESYTDDEGNRIYEAWVDGYGTTNNGSQVGYAQAPFAETKIVHGGKQAMPLNYSNAGAITISEAVRTFEAQDWTANGVKSLSLWFQGAAGNSGQLYLKINNTKVPYNGGAGDIAKLAWRPWNIDLSTVGGNLSHVTKLTIGVEGAGATGVVYIDDIRLYPKTPEFITPTDPGQANLLALYTFEGNTNDTSGHGLNGTIKQATLVSSGRTGGGSALQVEKAGYVDLGNRPSLDFGTGDWALTAWYKNTMTGTADADKGTIISKGGDNTGGKRYGLVMSETVSGVVTLVVDDDVTKYVTDSKSVTNDDRWHFVVGQRQGTTLQIWIDGQLEGSTTVPATYNLSGTSQHDAFLGAMTYHPDGSMFKLYNGLIDDVRIYDRALSQAEILWLAGSTSPVATPM